MLEGTVRDYTPFVGVVDPYETPDFLFFGDDTTSARAAVRLAGVVLIPAPVLAMAADGAISWTGVPGVTCTVESSADLNQWSASATVSSTTDRFTLTNSPALPRQYFRIRGP